MLCVYIYIYIQIHVCWSIYLSIYLSIHTYDSGYGANLSLHLQWELSPNLVIEGQVKYGNIQGSPFLSYPSPYLTPATLRLNVSATPTLHADGNSSVVYLPGSEDSHWLTFQGGHFGTFPEVVTVTYFNINNDGDDNDVYTCVTGSLYTGEEEDGEITDGQIVCRTEMWEDSGTYQFNVDVHGLTSNPGQDSLVFPDVPVVTNVTGCATDIQGGTYDCPTAGWVTLTITGEHFAVVGMVTPLSLKHTYTLSLSLS